MSEPMSKTFDCVQSMRQARDKISAEIAEMSYETLAEYLRAHRYEDPLLQRLAQMAAQRAVDKEFAWSRTAAGNERKSACRSCR